MQTEQIETEASYFKYWGKAAKDGSSYHLLPYHCLDVAAVASVWWEMSPSIRKAFCTLSELNSEQVRGWVLFFITLHDIGKFDIRFQQKVKPAWERLREERYPSRLSIYDSKNYFHGPAGLYWLDHEFEQVILEEVQTNSIDDRAFFDIGWEEGSKKSSAWKEWKPWFESVAGHHGHIVSAENNLQYQLPSDCPAQYVSHDKETRKAWIKKLELIFLKPVGLSLNSRPPLLSAISFMAGFCSVVDWLGSANSAEHFCFLQTSSNLIRYFEDRHDEARYVLEISGLIGKRKVYSGVQALLKDNHSPHQIQTIIDDLSCLPGLTIIEAPTGSGKTEAALAYAWRIINHNIAESIVFALPTQATANAMLGRLENLSTRLFENHPNLLLAHGNARFNEDFIKLCNTDPSRQGEDDEAWAQCSTWLSQSRKRAFLGQIGICTIDQVLTSVLPVRHRFIRGFGLGRSVLIVDEVHAYDTYMYGLLKAVLEEQKASGGSAVLLSATLPHYQRKELLQAWDKDILIHNSSEIPQYPLISQIPSHPSHEEFQFVPKQLPPEKSVWIDPVISRDCILTPELKQLIISAAENGAQIALICNLVDVAQQLFKEIKAETKSPVLLFHSRFTLKDRQDIEKTLIAQYGDKAERSAGSILISTQVVEQSLDVDFDWMITQLCPIDLLFQRLGRLHRHSHKNGSRPESFQIPRCSVLIPDDLDYGLHGLIYPNTRVMWRTAYKIEQLKDQPLVFPGAYRDWVESVYHEKPWGNEPLEVEEQYQNFIDNHQYVQKLAAQLMLNSTRNMIPYPDDDHHIAAVTRDGQMSLTMVPFVQTPKGPKLRDNSFWDQLQKENRYEALAMNKVGVPHTWRNTLDKFCRQEDGIYWLKMDENEDGWHSRLGTWDLRYNKHTGLERIK